MLTLWNRYCQSVTQTLTKNNRQCHYENPVNEQYCTVNLTELLLFYCFGFCERCSLLFPKIWKWQFTFSLPALPDLNLGPGASILDRISFYFWGNYLCQPIRIQAIGDILDSDWEMYKSFLPKWNEKPTKILAPRTAISAVSCIGYHHQWATAHLAFCTTVYSILYSVSLVRIRLLRKRPRIFCK